MSAGIIWNLIYIPDFHLVEKVCRLVIFINDYFFFHNYLFINNICAPVMFYHLILNRIETVWSFYCCLLCKDFQPCDIFRHPCVNPGVSAITLSCLMSLYPFVLTPFRWVLRWKHVIELILTRICYCTLLFSNVPL